MNKNNLYLVSHKGKQAILITDNAHFQDGKLKLGDKVIADKLPKTSNKDAMIWSLSAENATKFLDIANINNFVQGRNLIDLTTPAKASHELSSNTQSNTVGHTQKRPAPQPPQKGSNEDLSR